jgi:hypothetical protein
MTNIGYHFVDETLRDGRPVPLDGEWLEHDGKLAMCESGLHWSAHPFDALKYAPGAILCLVETDGKTIYGNDKSVSRRRKILKRIDATDLLRGFARWQAYQVLHIWDAPAVVVRFLETGDEALREAARDAAWDAAEAAVWDATRAAARAAAWDAARAAAWDAARDAAEATARDAAWDAAWFAAKDAARDAARDDFELLVNMAFNGWECKE